MAINNKEGKSIFAQNGQNRCPVVLLLDKSYSMSGNAIDQLNQGLVAFKNELEKDNLAKLRVEIAIISFGPVTSELNFTSIDNYVPKPLKAEQKNLTPMGEAINRALEKIEERKRLYKINNIDYYRPWIVLITDGEPTDDENYWKKAVKTLKQAEEDKKCTVFAIGVEGANTQILSEISSKRSPMKLKDYNFTQMFLWLSASLTSVSQSSLQGQVKIAPPSSDWAEGIAPGGVLKILAPLIKTAANVSEMGENVSELLNAWTNIFNDS